MTQQEIPPLPNNIIEAVQAAVADGDNQQWRMGRLLADLVDEFVPHYKQVGVKQPRAWLIRHMAARVGADPSTLRDRESMARFYPESVTEEFSMLTYHQLRACKSAGDRWREYAEWAADNLPAPVALIRARLRNGGALPPSWLRRWELIRSMAVSLVNDNEAPRDIVAACQVIASMDDD